MVGGHVYFLFHPINMMDNDIRCHIQLVCAPITTGLQYLVSLHIQDVNNCMLYDSYCAISPSVS